MRMGFNQLKASKPGMIFVFGSNEAGRHGAGAAKHAYRYKGAVYGRGEGLQGQSYAIPTKDRHLKTLPLTAIEANVERFLEFARRHREWQFQVTAIGTGLAGYEVEDIAPMFRFAPGNCELAPEFQEWLDARWPPLMDPPPGVELPR